MIVAAAVDPEDARRTARDIVRSRRYQPEDVPRPLEGVLRWIGDRLRPITDFLDGVVDFFSEGVGLVLLVVIIAALVTLVALYLVRRARAPVDGERRRRAAGARREDPDALEREASEAERAGDLDRALRLRFRAGLLRLDRVGAITFRPSLTSGQVTRAVPLPELDELARTFEGVAYGGRPARPPDLDAARTGWPRVVDAARSR